MVGGTDELVIGVLSGCGGAGGSTFAAVLAARLAAERAGALLVDCDPLGGGLDVLLGCEALPGPRWGQVRLSGGALDAGSLRADLPNWQGVSLLAADSATPIEPPAVSQLVAAAAGVMPVVLDLPRWTSAVRDAAVARCDLVVVVTPAELRSVASTAAVIAGLDAKRILIVARGSSRPVSRQRISAVLGVEVLGPLPYDRAGEDPSGLQPHRLRRGTKQIAGAVIDRAMSLTVAA